MMQAIPTLEDELLLRVSLVGARALAVFEQTGWNSKISQNSHQDYGQWDHATSAARVGGLMEKMRISPMTQYEFAYQYRE